jgi:hypothetical protein
LNPRFAHRGTDFQLPYLLWLLTALIDSALSSPFSSGISPMVEESIQQPWVRSSATGGAAKAVSIAQGGESGVAEMSFESKSGMLATFGAVALAGAAFAFFIPKRLDYGMFLVAVGVILLVFSEIARRNE